jgi:hypothetical protein
MTTISIIIIFIIFLCSSYVLHRVLIRIKSVTAFIIIALLYLIGTYYYFEIINSLDNALTDKKIYLEFGHANIILILILFICILLAIINILLAILKRRRINKLINEQHKI